MKTLIYTAIALMTTAAAQMRPIAAVETPGNNLPIQRIGANDLVAISVYDAPELTRTVRVDGEGFVRLPMLKRRLKAEGLMPSELESSIAVALQSAQLVIDPFVTVTVAEYHSRPISVMGAVRRPLTFQAAGPVTLLDALARAEGLTQDAGPEVLLSKPQKDDSGAVKTLVKRITVKALINTADPEVNLPLTGGEEIRVPEAGKIFVVGNVKKPGAFGLHENGEISPFEGAGARRRAFALRRKTSFHLSLRGSDRFEERNRRRTEDRFCERKSPDVAMQPNDILHPRPTETARSPTGEDPAVRHRCDHRSDLCRIPDKHNDA